MKDCTTCKYGFVDEQFGFPMCHHPLRFSEDCVDFNMHEEIEEPEKANSIEEKKLPDGLEKAAYKKVREMFGNDMVDWGGHSLVDASNAADLFIAGAKWDRAKMMEDAVEADVNTYGDLVAGKSWAEFVVEMPTNNLGDKVKIIIVKEDGK